MMFYVARPLNYTYVLVRYYYVTKEL
jgi:hypothetical protein